MGFRVALSLLVLPLCTGCAAWQKSVSIGLEVKMPLDIDPHAKRGGDTVAKIELRFTKEPPKKSLPAGVPPAKMAIKSDLLL